MLRLINKDCDRSPPFCCRLKGLTQCIFGSLRRFTLPPGFVEPRFLRLPFIVFRIESNLMVNQRLVKSHQTVLEKIPPAKGAAQWRPRHDTQKWDSFSILL